jgi:hypothetical protein
MDRAWGAVIGLIFLVFIGGSFFVGQISGANAGGCDRALAPLPGGTAISAEAFNAEDASLGRVITSFGQGDSATADATFYGPVHSFMHNVDPPVRLADANIARNLCNTVVQLETDLIAGSNATNSRMADDTTKAREALRDGAVVLGYARPGS